jgi:hypothetical protein
MAKTIDTEDATARDATDQRVAEFVRRHVNRSELPMRSAIDDELLARYVDGALDEGEKASLEARLVTDLDARERVGILVGGLGDAGYPAPQLPDHVIVRASRYVFAIMGDALEVLRGQGVTALHPALAVRSGTSNASRPSAYQIEREFQTAQGLLAARFELHAERADAGSLVDLVVHVGAAGAPAEGIRCKLLRDGRPIDSREVEGDGCTFAHLGPARYDVELRKGGVEVGRLLLDLRG